MKNKETELDVDFIGGEKPLTKEDEEAISKFIREYKEKHKKAGKRAKILRGKILPGKTKTKPVKSEVVHK